MKVDTSFSLGVGQFLDKEGCILTWESTDQI